jgi:hypothetical protein
MLYMHMWYGMLAHVGKGEPFATKELLMQHTDL